MKRQFLLGTLLLVLTAVIVGCGGGGGGGKGANSPDTPPSLDSAVISTILSSAQTQLDLLFQSDTEPTVEQIKTALETIEGIEVIGVSEEEDTVVGKIVNGPLLYITLPLPAGSYDPATNPALKSIQNLNTLTSASSNRSLPAGTNVLLLNGLGGKTYKNINPDIKKIFTDYYASPNYNVTTQEATIENLRAVNNVDVLFIKTHGALNGKISPYKDPNRLYTYVITSSTRVDLKDPSPQVYNVDINKHNIVFIWACTEKEGIIFKNHKYEWLYGITFGFIEKYWRLNPGGMAFICACWSASPNASTFQGAIFEKGTSVFIGWNERIDSDVADHRAKYVFDRLLGANSFEKTDPAQRAFTFLDVEEDMKNKNLLTWPGDGKLGPSTLTFLKNNINDNNQFGILAPSIKYLEIDEKIDSSETPIMTIHGIFGDKPGKVILNGSKELAVKLWCDDEIQCFLPPDDAGDVVVKVNGIPSNKRRSPNGRVR